MMNTHKHRLCQFKLYAPAKRYQDINVTGASIDSPLIHANSKLIGVNWATGNNGSLYVFPVSNVGRHKSSPPLLNAHSGAVTAFAFSPFVSGDSSVLVTGSDDSSVGVWKVPNEGLKEHMGSAHGSLEGHSGRITCIRHHPQAENLVATSSLDKSVRLWDIAKCEELRCLEHGDGVFDFSWSPDGKYIVTVAKDKIIRIFDPRKGECIAQTEGEPGVKPARVLWAKGAVVYTGFSKFRERIVRIYKAPDGVCDFGNLLRRWLFDSGQGPLQPLYDEDTDLLFLAGKGDSSVSMHLLLPEGKDCIVNVNSFNSDCPAKGFALLPKTSVDVMECEVDRLLKVAARSVDTIKVEAPRRSHRDFHADLFPDTIPDIPALTVAEWLDGQDKLQERVSLEPVAKSPSSNLLSVATPTSPRSPMALASEGRPRASSALSPGVSSPPTRNRSASSGAVGSPVEAKGHWEEHTVRDMSKFIRPSKFKHVFPKNVKKELAYHDLKVEGGDPVIDTNGIVFAFPWSGVDGRVCLVPIANVGRVFDDRRGLVEVHSSSISEIKFSFLDPQLLAVGAEDSHLCVLRIPEDASAFVGKEIKKGDESVIERFELHGHERRVTSVAWHPSVPGILATGAMDGQVRVWDLAARETMFKVSLYAEGEERLEMAMERGILSVEWSTAGNELLAAVRDCTIVTIDPRTETVLTKTRAHDTFKGFTAHYLGDSNQLFTCGFGKGSERQFMVFDRRALGEDAKPLSTVQIDHQNGVLFPHFDEDTKCVVCPGRGGLTYRWYEADDEPPYLHGLCEVKASKICSATCWMPKRFLDVKAVEVARALTLYGKEDVDVIGFHIPRTRMEFFQDDIFPDTAKVGSTGAVDEWCNGMDFSVEKVSLRPEGMENLSDNPEEKTTVVKRFVVDEKEAGGGGTEHMFEHVHSHIHSQMEDIMKWKDPTEEMEGVDEDEWGDDSD